MKLDLSTLAMTDGCKRLKRRLRPNICHVWTDYLTPCSHRATCLVYLYWILNAPSVTTAGDGRRHGPCPDGSWHAAVKPTALTYGVTWNCVTAIPND